MRILTMITLILLLSLTSHVDPFDYTFGEIEFRIEEEQNPKEEEQTPKEEPEQTENLC